ncbi:hypothetical protein ACYX8G_14605 [Microbacterium saperdae]
MALTVTSFTDVPSIATAFPELVNHPLLDADAWRALRDSVLPPDEVTPLVTTWQTRLEFLVGATLLGLIEHFPGGRTAKPQQLLVADVMNAGRPLNAILEPRRSTKTSSILAVHLGRCAVRPRRRSAFTLATTGLKAREKFREEIVDPIEARWPDAALRPVKIHKAGGGERLEFPNRSVYSVHPPIGSSFRSSAYDDVLVDEGGESEDAMTDDLLAAIPPTFDTTGGALVVSGTAGKRRGAGNLLHRMLTDKALDAAILRYSAPDTTTDEELAAWEPTEEHPEGRVRELIEQHHPGVGNLTPLDAVHRSYLLMPRDVFTREYLGIFGEDGAAVTLFDPLKWARTGLDGALPAPGTPAFPARWSLAFAAHPDSLCTSIMAAWRDADGKAVGLLLDDLPGIDTAPKALLKARRYRVPIVYDDANQANRLIIEALNREKNRPRIEPRVFAQAKVAASSLVDEVDRENVVHWRDQLVLTEAVHKTVKRRAGQGNGWLLGRDPKQPNDNITPVEAWALALHHYDNSRPKAKGRSQVAA